MNRLPLYVYGNPANLVNNAPVAANSLRQCMGRIGAGLGHAAGARSLCRDPALQRAAAPVVRRLSQGLQMGASHTLAKGEGYMGYDPYTDEIGGEDAIKARTGDRRQTIAGTTWSSTTATSSRSSRTCRCEAAVEQLADLRRREVVDGTGRDAVLHVEQRGYPRTPIRR